MKARNVAYAAERSLYYKDRRLTDLNFRLECALRGRFAGHIIAGSPVCDLGCSIEHLRLHLELFWGDGMSWENWGYGKSKWNIDHIKPVSKFDVSDRNQFLEVVHYSNLQPLWYEDNMRKSTGNGGI
jgi:hypothetical protein